VELRQAMERGETVYRVGVETLTRAQAERRVVILADAGNEGEAKIIHAMIDYPVEGIGVGHGYYCACGTCVDARERAWRAR